MVACVDACRLVLAVISLLILGVLMRSSSRARDEYQVKARARQSGLASACPK
jgi:hypothetical protein